MGVRLKSVRTLNQKHSRFIVSWQKNGRSLKNLSISLRNTSEAILLYITFTLPKVWINLGLKLFYLFFLYIAKEERTVIVKFFNFRFFMDLHVLRCPEYDLTISGKCMSVCLWNFVASVARELMSRISWNFIFSITQI